MDLDSVFGGGPGRRPDLYVDNPDGSVGPKLQIGSGGVHEDVPRVANGDGTYTALLGDPRNDENVMIAGLHCAHILFYNRVLDELSEHDLGRFDAAAAHRADPGDRYIAFLLAREVTLWHYQWLLVNEHLPQIAGQRWSMTSSPTATASTGRRRATPSCPSSSAPPPTASATAWCALRTGPTSPAAPATAPDPTADPFFALVFDQTEPNFSAPVTYDRDDLLGGYPAPRRYVGWQTFFDLGDGKVKNNKKIDTTISSVLFTLPVPAIAPHTQTAPTVLPQRNLLRQLTWGLPSGQAVARSDGRPSAQRRPTWPTSPPSTPPSPPARRCGTTSWPKPRSRRAACTWGRSAAGSWPRPSSACCGPTPPAT